MKCEYCEVEHPVGDKFCGNCGKPVAAQEPQKIENREGINFRDIASKINSVAGIDTPIEIKFKEVFSNVFVKHTEEDAEKLFFVGTSETTPQIENIVDQWPRPWLFARIFLIVGLLYLGLYIGVEQFYNLNFLPGLITIGSFIVPITILIFFWEMNVPQSISIYKVIKTLFIGGVLSLIMAVFMYEFTGDINPITIGIVEEVAKGLIIIWFLREKRYTYIFNGLLIGAAVGTGFAAFESAGYALRMALYADFDTMYSTIFWRGVLAPGGHIVWAALCGAAICMVKGNEAFTWSMLKNIKFLRIFGIVILLHALWDTPIANATDLPILQIVFMIISWIIAFGVMSAGLKEITSLKDSHSLEAPIMPQQDTTVSS